MKWLSLAWRNVWRNRRRSALAIAVMAVGVVAVLTAIGFMLASFHGLRESTIRGGLGHVQIAAPEGVIGPTEAATLDKALRGRPEVRLVTRRLVFEGLVSSGPLTVAALGSGVDPVGESRLAAGFAPVVSGSGLPVGEIEAGETGAGETGAGETGAGEGGAGFSAMLGIGLAAKLGVKPGDDITVLATTIGGVLNAIDLTVAGTFTTGIPDLDSRQVQMGLPAAELLLGTRGASRLVVLARADGQETAILDWLGRNHPGVIGHAWDSLAPFHGQVVTLYRNIFAVLGAIILLVVVLSASNTMLMAVSERVQEMGTMLALGIGRTRIRFNFALEGAIMGALAGAAGVVVAGGVALAINLAGIEMPPPPGRTMPYPLVIFVSPPAYAAVFAAMVAAGALAAWLPTGRLRRLQIIDALRQT